MDGVVAGVGLGRESELLPLGEHGTAQRIRGSLRRVCGSAHIAAEISPGKLGRVPLYDVEENTLAGLDVRRPHAHEEPVENVSLLALMGDISTIEASTKLDQLPGLLSLSPEFIELVSVNSQVLTPIHCVEHLSGVQRSLPLNAELTLELVGRHIELVRFQDCCLGSNCVVVVVNQLLLIDNFGLQRALLHNPHTLLLQVALHELLHLVRHRVGLDEKEGAVLHHDRGKVAVGVCTDVKNTADWKP
mmetsp:Transcript_9060/g.21653  ORF Transcript_9060/g.21653 Transcript_9060/m.21653 type:complete len:246 (+) Transcript_9060:1168-1905(+)